MLLQTNSYIVPRDKRVEHARLLRRFRQTLLRLGCDHFEVYEQVGANWNTGETTGRFVQIMRFRDRKHQLSVQAAERGDPIAQQVVQEFCELINFPYQQQQGLFAVGFYTSFLRMPPQRTMPAEPAPEHAESAAEHHVEHDVSAHAGELPATQEAAPDEHAGEEHSPDPMPAPHPGIEQQLEEHPDEVDMNTDDVLAHGHDEDPGEDPEALLATDPHGMDDTQESGPGEMADSPKP